MKGRTPTAEEKRYMDAVGGLGCLVCYNDGIYTPGTVHHCDGKTMPGAHFKIFNLCGLHHQGGRDCAEYTARHPFKAAFQRRYGSEESLMEQTRKLVHGGVEHYASI